MNDKNRVLVIGDAMIDTYIYGNVERVSPEAPVPVVTMSQKVYCLGGAANVALNAVTLGAQVDVLFVLGSDDNGRIIKEKLTEAGIGCRMVCMDASQNTIHKMRVVGNKQQITRIDWHDAYSLSDELQNRVLNAFRTELHRYDVIVLSDYGKGTCTETICKEVIRAAREAGKPVIVDPKGTNWEKYRGAALVTPNLRELNLFSGKDTPNVSEAIDAAYAGINDRIGVDHVLLTRSECGMSLIQGSKIIHFPAEAQEVFDVSGAGDTVVAAVASVLSPQMDNLVGSVEIANIAAGIAVAKPGTATVTMEEVQNTITRRAHGETHGKIYTENEYDLLKKTLRFWRMTGAVIVTTNGCFDILHRGHVKVFEEAKKLGSKLIVAVNSDESVKRLKGSGRPINPQMDRAYLIAALSVVDAVVIFDPQHAPYRLSQEQAEQLSSKALRAAGEAPMSLLSMIAPDVHVKGGDYQIGDIPEALFAQKTVFIPFVDGYSTTKVIQRIEKHQSGEEGHHG